LPEETQCCYYLPFLRLLKKNPLEKVVTQVSSTTARAIFSLAIELQHFP